MGHVQVMKVGLACNRDFSFDIRFYGKLCFQEIALQETDFDERRNVNKRKRLILEGLDPDEVEAEKQRKRKEGKKRLKKERKQRMKVSSDSAKA